MPEENKALMRRFYDLWVHAGDLDVLDEIIAPDQMLHNPDELLETHSWR